MLRTTDEVIKKFLKNFREYKKTKHPMPFFETDFLQFQELYDTDLLESTTLPKILKNKSYNLTEEEKRRIIYLFILKNDTVSNINIFFSLEDEYTKKLYASKYINSIVIFPYQNFLETINNDDSYYDKFQSIFKFNSKENLNFLYDFKILYSKIDQQKYKILKEKIKNINLEDFIETIPIDHQINIPNLIGYQLSQSASSIFDCIKNENTQMIDDHILITNKINQFIYNNQDIIKEHYPNAILDYNIVQNVNNNFFNAPIYSPVINFINKNNNEEHLKRLSIYYSRTSKTIDNFNLFLENQILKLSINSSSSENSLKIINKRL